MGQKWEYCSVSNVEILDANRRRTYTYKTVASFATTPPKSHEFASTDEAMAALGSLEWELVEVVGAVYSSSNNNISTSITYYFKRPIVPGRAIDQ